MEPRNNPFSLPILAIIIVLVAVAAFGLGRLSALQEQKTPLQIHYPAQSQEQGSTTVQTQVQ